MSLYSRPSYQDIIASCLEETNTRDELAGCSPETMKVWILEACQRITNECRVEESRSLRLIQSQEDYIFSNSPVPVTGTGLITSTANLIKGTTSVGAGTITSGVTTNTPTTSSTVITGVGTSFITQLSVGEMLIVGTEAHEITEIDSQTQLLINSTFTVPPVASAYSFSSTKFGKELTVGSVIVASGQTFTVTVITDGYNITVQPPANPDIASQAFTIDTKVTEIPVRMRAGLYYIDRLESNFRREIKLESIGWLLELRKQDMIVGTYTNYNTPYAGAVYRNTQQQYALKVYPVPDAHKDCTIYANIKIDPRLFIGDALSASIQLDETYEGAIRLYLQSKLWGWLKKFDIQQARYNEFKETLNDLNRNVLGPGKVRMVYK